ncbi:hypothetical protein FK220_005915 [Flavobacteriaceae bacterium TP-CH-4]|uniref:DUF4381 domain-containing protein n=1 Tax=Pelagihabitans pacificus TaxID=2696054 RepID=A0A967AR53_9FLAO|nr:hypothetical protein [Pelagihabitans pacificus]NHF58866.1 hypothetical protein [Pelagihabitans pacificus]
MSNTVVSSFLKRCCLLCFFTVSLQLFSQTPPRISSEVDTTFIKIGDQIMWKVLVETDTTAQVIFPEGQTFSPLETVEAFKTDTTRKKDRMALQKTYALTQFDSGVYKLPAQRIEIDGRGYFTDSLMVNVATVPVDTTTQKMFDIKPLMEVEKSNAKLWKIMLGIVLGLFVLGVLFYWFVIRKKPLTEEEKEALLPPYDRALLELKKLENSKYLIQDEYKQYYSELTDIVRSYLEEDVHVSALESTTDELIDKLEMLKDAGELELDDDTLDQFKKILQTADLVKFAKSKPPTTVAEQDRKSIEQIVIKTHEALPEPTEEELMQQAEFLEEYNRKKQRRKIIIGSAAVLALLFTISAIAIARYGFSYLKDTVLGHPTKELLDGEWVASSYGYPPILLETPKVLKREQVSLSAEEKEAISEISTFNYQSLAGLFSIEASSLILTKGAEFKLDLAIENYLKGLESRGTKNIITKQEEFTTVSGIQGIKTYGSGKFVVPGEEDLVNGNYLILSFGGEQFQQQVALTWLKEDPYAQEIVDRILKTIEVKTEV